MEIKTYTEFIGEKMKDKENKLKRKDKNTQLVKFIKGYGFNMLYIDRYVDNLKTTYAIFKRNKVTIECGINKQKGETWKIENIHIKLCDKETVDIIMKNINIVNKFNELLNDRIASIDPDMKIKFTLGFDKNNTPNLQIINNVNAKELNIKIYNDQNGIIYPLKLNKLHAEYLGIPFPTYNKIYNILKKMISIPKLSKQIK